MRTPCFRAFRWAVLGLAVGLLFLLAQPPGEAAPDGPRVELRTLDAPRVAGRLVGLDAKALRLETTPGSPPQAFPLGRVVELRFPPPPQIPRTVDHLRAHLTGGDVLLGRFAGPAPEGILLAVDGLGSVAVSFDAILTLEVVPFDAGPCHRPARGHPPAESGDIAYDALEDEYRGTVLEATADHLVMDSTRGRRRTVPWTKLNVLHLENDALPAPKGLQGELELANGSRVALTGIPRITSTGMVLTSRSLPEISLAIPYVAARSLRWWGGQFDYATMLPFRSALQWHYPGPEGHIEYLEGFYGARVGWRSHSGCPLRLDRVTYRHGFGVNSRSTIEIPLGGNYRTFRAVFGIDDEVLKEPRSDGLRGDVDARVLGDGKVLWEAKGVQGGQKPRRIGPVDLAGVQTLVLEVGFGRDLMTLDRADWVDPILERK